MRCGYIVLMRWMVIYKYGVPGGALNLNSANYPDHVTMGILPYQGKIPMVEPGIEPRTSDHSTMRLVCIIFVDFLLAILNFEFQIS
jgi:hypothetical protein